MQGFNMGRYVPPDVEGTTTGNKLHNKHALGARASKLRSSGALTVRFEMPFAIWCSSCPRPTIIGQGVRFNAEKKRVGNYHSTPIWSFRFRHAACSGQIEMRTDPQNTAYVVVSGATKRDTGEDGGVAAAREGDMVIQTQEERDKARASAFASLEKTIADREALREATERIDELQDVAKKQWDDPYTLNQKLRRTFRAGRKEREKAEERTEGIRERMGLGIELLPESEADARRAALVDFGEEDGGGADGDAGAAALAMPLFGDKKHESGSLKSRDGKTPVLKGDRRRARDKQAFVTQVMGNARASRDPFLQQRNGEDGARKPSAKLLPGLKRKRDAEEGDDGSKDKKEEEPPAKAPDGHGRRGVGLVAYESDSD